MHPRFASPRSLVFESACAHYLAEETFVSSCSEASNPLTSVALRHVSSQILVNPSTPSAEISRSRQQPTIKQLFDDLIGEVLWSERGEQEGSYAYLLWFVGAKAHARRAFESLFRSGTERAALPIFFLTGGDADRRLELSCSLDAQLSPGPIRSTFRRAIFADFWLRRDEPEQANDFLFRTESWADLPERLPLRGRGSLEVAKAIAEGWRRALKRGAWGEAIWLQSAAALLGDERQVRLLEPGPNAMPLPLLTWAIDHSELRFLDPSGLWTAAEHLQDEAEAATFKVLSIRALESRAPDEAARRAADLAESGVDHLAAYLRALSQRGFVSANQLANASDAAQARTELCLDLELVESLTLLRVLYGLAGGVDANKLTIPSQRLMTQANPHLGGELLFQLHERVLHSGGDRSVLAEFLRDKGGPSRSLERLFLQGNEPKLMSILALLHEGLKTPDGTLGAIFQYVPERVSEADLRESLLAEVSSGEAFGDLLFALRDFLRLRNGEPLTSRWLPPAVHTLCVQDVADPKLTFLLEGLTSSPVTEIAGKAALLLAFVAIKKNDTERAFAALVEASSLLKGSPEVAYLAENLGSLLGDPTLADSIRNRAKEIRFQSRLRQEPEAAVAYLRAVDHSTSASDRQKGARILLQAGRGAQAPALKADLLELAASWFAENEFSLDEAITASREAVVHSETAETVSTHVKLLARAEEFGELATFLITKTKGGRSFEGVVEAEAIRRAVATWPTIATSESKAHGLEQFASVCIDSVRGDEEFERLARLVIDIKVASGRHLEAARWLDAQLAKARTVGAQASLELIKGELEGLASNDESAWRHFRMALESRGRVTEFIDRVMDVYAANGRWRDLAARLIITAERTARREIRTECLLQAALVLWEQCADLEGAESLWSRVLLHEVPDSLGSLTNAKRLLAALGVWGDVDEVLRRLARIAAPGAERSRVLQERAEVQRDSLGSPGKALQVLMEAFAEDPSELALFEELESGLHKACRYEGLRQLYGTALEAQKAHPTLPYDLEELSARKGQVEFYELDLPFDAAKSLTDALRVNPGEERYQSLIDEIAAVTSSPELSSTAVELQLNSLSSEHPRRVQVLVAAAQAYERMPGGAARRLELLIELVELAPADPYGAKALSEHWGQAGKVAEQIVVLKRFCEVSEDTDKLGPALRTLGSLQEPLDIEASIEAYETLVKHVDPDDKLVLASLSRLHKQRHDWRRLVWALRELLRLEDDPDERAELFSSLGVVFESDLGDRVRARSSFERALEEAPNCRAARQGIRRLQVATGDFEGLVLSLEHLASTEPDEAERSRLLVECATIYQDELGDWGEAEKMLLEAAIRSDERGWARSKLLDVYISAQQWSKASSLVSELEEMDGMEETERARLRFQEGIIAREMGDLDRAITAFEVALEHDPLHQGAFSSLVELFENRHDTPHLQFVWKLRARLRKLYAENPDPALRPKVAACLVNVLLHSATSNRSAGDIDATLEDLQAAVEIEPDRVDTLDDLLEILIGLRRFEEAFLRVKEFCDRAVKGSRTWKHGCLRAGDFALNWLDDPESAVAYYLELKTASPGDLEVGYLLAQALMRAGQVAEANTQMTRLGAAYRGARPEQMPESSRLVAADHQYYLGLTFEHLGQAEEAEKHYLLALRFSPRHPSGTLAVLKLLWKQGRWSELEIALQSAEGALSDPRDAETLNRVRLLGAHAFRETNPDRSTESLERILSQRPNDREALSTLARFRGDTDPEGALETIRRTMETGQVSDRLVQDYAEIAARAGHRSLPALGALAAVLGIELSVATPPLVGAPASIEELVAAELSDGLFKAFRRLSQDLGNETRRQLDLTGLRGTGHLAPTAQDALKHAQRALVDAWPGLRSYDLRGFEAGAVAGGVQVRRAADRIGLELYLSVKGEDDLGAAQSDEAKMLLARGNASASLGLDVLTTLPEEELTEWFRWLLDVASDDARPPRDVALTCSKWDLSQLQRGTAYSKHDDLARIVRRGASAGHRTLDRIGALVGGLEAALIQVLELDLGIEVEPGALRNWLEQSERARALVCDFLAFDGFRVP